MTFFNGENMTDERLKTMIPNWTMFGAQRIVINIFEREIDNETVYTSALLFWLDDGIEDSEEKTVTVFTDIVTESSKKAALILGEYASAIFENVDAIAYVFGEKNEIIEEIDMNKLEDEDFPEINLEDFGMVETHKKIIH